MSDFGFATIVEPGEELVGKFDLPCPAILSAILNAVLGAGGFLIYHSYLY